ncbi:HlyD family secretion protein [Rubripirellula reticaptiva]|uniref:Multidrug resistance protein MdtA n=1 Tax=Rubripirellula reticaptiva TaxID=2528013 RepID=A0A5C6FCL7_9BACT|nr:hypothetical protein [Rubripirellula reticaptiva]TWU58377.1 Multidrug resistance protein MdtA [Rubripirellula reticaptiva]
MNRFVSKTRWLTRYVLPTIILVGSAVAFYPMGSTPEVPRKPKTAIKATVVEVAEIHALDGPLTIETTGEVVLHRVLSIASEVEGRIVFKHPNLRVGEQVDAGETLIKIDPQRFALTVQRLDITVNQAATTLKQLQQDRANLAEQVTLARQSQQILVDDLERILKLDRSQATSTSPSARSPCRLARRLCESPPSDNAQRQGRSRTRSFHCWVDCRFGWR